MKIKSLLLGALSFLTFGVFGSKSTTDKFIGTSRQSYHGYRKSKKNVRDCHLFPRSYNYSRYMRGYLS